MQLQRNDLTPQQIHQLETVSIEKLEAFLKDIPLSDKQTSSQPSKWAKLVEEIEDLNISNETIDFIRKSSKELREDL